jgi:AbrB family looped-hinge helix DNA binding protein
MAYNCLLDGNRLVWYNLFMQVVPNKKGEALKEMLSSISPKGQVTIPIEIRRMLGVKPKDLVEFKVEGREVRLVPASASIRAFYQAVPALDPPRTLDEMTAIAAEAHAREVAEEG